MGSRVHLAVDAMSGDFGPPVILPAALQALDNHPGLYVSLVGEEGAIKDALANLDAHRRHSARIQVEHATCVLPMDASPRDTLRGPQNSSLHRALDLLAQSRVDGVVSAGNTAALLTLGRRHISMLPGFSRPAYCSAIPVRSGFRYMMDLGANVDCDADSLLEFACLGTTLINVLEECPRPGVALLCNGSEMNKGNLAIREAAQRMEEDPLINYCGFIEGNQLLQPGPELVICDGMLGNIALKTAEGTAEFATQLVSHSFSKHWWLRLVAMAAAPAFRELKTALSADRHGGAFLLGLDGVVVKSHGGSSSDGFFAALDTAARCVERDMIARLAHILDDRQPTSPVKHEDLIGDNG